MLTQPAFRRVLSEAIAIIDCAIASGVSKRLRTGVVADLDDSGVLHSWQRSELLAKDHCELVLVGGGNELDIPRCPHVASGMHPPTKSMTGCVKFAVVSTTQAFAGRNASFNSISLGWLSRLGMEAIHSSQVGQLQEALAFSRGLYYLTHDHVGRFRLRTSEHALETIASSFSRQQSCGLHFKNSVFWRPDISSAPLERGSISKKRQWIHFGRATDCRQSTRLNPLLSVTFMPPCS